MNLIGVCVIETIFISAIVYSVETIGDTSTASACYHPANSITEPTQIIQILFNLTILPSNKQVANR